MAKIRITGDVAFLKSGSFEKIKAIKLVRSVWGLGLKDAKELVDNLQATGLVTADLDFPATTWLQELAAFRIRVHAEASMLHTRLKNLVIAAIRANELELAEELLPLFKKYSAV